MDFLKKAADDAVKLVSIEPTGQRFGYRVTFAVTGVGIAGRLGVDVAFTHGKRERAPHLDEIEAEGRKQMVAKVRTLIRSS